MDNYTSGYGQQSAIFIPRIAALGYDLGISCFFGLEGGCLEWNDIHCYPTDQSRFGNLMLGEYAHHHGGGDRQNTLILTLQDVWVLLAGLANFQDCRFACWTPIDHDPVPPLVKKFLTESQAQVIAMTRFGETALQNAGYDPLYVPHGIDTGAFKPEPSLKAAFRESLKMPPDAFVVGMVANNQGIPSRKSFPQVFCAFKEFQQRHTDAILYVHADVFGRNAGLNLIELGKACEIPPEAMRTSDQTSLHLGLPPESMARIYNSFDVLCMPSMGEGFGIPLIEAQACGIPVVTTNWTAMTELCGAGWLVEGERFYDQQGSFQKLPYIGDILQALEDAYDRAGNLGVAAREFALGYDADTVTERYWKPVLEECMRPREIAPLRLAA
jgi:glycosyltransferase involved in cell wall biosynthesis